MGKFCQYMIELSTNDMMIASFFFFFFFFFFVCFFLSFHVFIFKQSFFFLWNHFSCPDHELGWSITVWDNAYNLERDAENWLLF